MNTEEENEFRHLWDGSEQWVLLKVEQHLTRLTLRFTTKEPSISEIQAVRRLLPQYQQLPPAQVKAILGDCGEFELPLLPRAEAEKLSAQAKELDLCPKSVDASYTGYSPFCPVNRSVCMIEGDALAAQVYRRMLDSGVPVVDYRSVAP